MMRNIFILLCCSLLLYVYVWQTNPEFIAREMPSLVPSHFTMPLPPASAPKVDKVGIKPSATGTRTVHAAVAPVAAIPEADTPIVEEVPAPVETPEPAVPIRKPAPAPPVFSVSSAAADLYLSNSSDSKVLMVLKKGDVVKPQYQFNNQGQEWTFVNLANSKASGFIRTGSVEKIEAPAEK